MVRKEGSLASELKYTWHTIVLIIALITVKRSQPLTLYGEVVGKESPLGHPLCVGRGPAVARLHSRVDVLRPLHDSITIPQQHNKQYNNI